MTRANSGGFAVKLETTKSGAVGCGAGGGVEFPPPEPPPELQPKIIKTVNKIELVLFEARFFFVSYVT